VFAANRCPNDLDIDGRCSAAPSFLQWTRMTHVINMRIQDIFAKSMLLSVAITSEIPALNVPSDALYKRSPPRLV
jgi:hypothetical protein